MWSAKMDVVTDNFSQCSAVSNLAEPKGDRLRVEAAIRESDRDTAAWAEYAMDLGKDFTRPRQVVDAAYIGHEVDGLIGKRESGVEIEVGDNPLSRLSVGVELPSNGVASHVHLSGYGCQLKVFYDILHVRR
jgi:hypothetical protein